MRKQYDDFTQMKLKDMCKNISDMTYTYINPETQEPTRVPAAHYEKELSQELEKTITQVMTMKFLSIMYDQLNAFKKENEDLFYKALICMDNGLNPKDLRISEQIALNHTYEFLQNKQLEERRKFHFFSQDITDEYQRGLTDPDLQAEKMDISNFIENQRQRELNRIGEENIQVQNDNLNSHDEYEEEEEYDREY